MTEKGTGTGKASLLLMRTPDHRWVEVPYGAGQDSNVRSVNVWNGSEWLCPTWGRLLWPDMFTDPGLLADLDSLQYRSNKVIWTGWSDYVNNVDRHEVNPTYRHHEANSDQFTLSNGPKWVRLFYLRQRSIPTYRIVPLNYPLPRHPPNRTIDYDSQYDARFSFQTMWPAFTLKTDMVEDGLYTTPTSHTAGNTLYGGPNLLPTLCQTKYVHTTGPASTYNDVPHAWVSDHREYTVGMVDLKAIRQRLSTTFAEQDVTFTGQKNKMADQELQWVIVKFQIQPFLSYWVAEGEEMPGGIDFDQVVFNMRTDWGVPMNTESQVSEPIMGEYRADYHYPTTSDPQGNSIWSIATQSLPHVQTVAHQDLGIRPGYPRFWNTFGVATLPIQFEYKYEYPGEDNIAFYAEILNVPGWDETKISEVDIQLVMTYKRITLGYRDNFTTFPQDLIRWDALP